ncbi:MAG: folate-binding protein YgfZ [Pasteurellaceae bacterium]|nr:folate-binding protein YgfZ [Pasteurellaceae bacterium]
MAQFIELEPYRIIEIKGEDAEKYLQGQLTCDVNQLETGQSTLTAHCDPKGKVNLLLRLIRLSEKSANEQRFYGVIRADLLPIGLANLKKYAVFSKVSFTELNAQLIGIIGEAQVQAETFVQIGSRARYLAINPTTAIEINGSINEWDKADIEQGYPILQAKDQGEWIPQALNLQAIEQAISFQKGCYIGQETVARAKYRGINKRAMYAFCTQTSLSATDITDIEIQLETNWRKTGAILTAVNNDQTLYLQVILNKLENEQAFRISEQHTPLTLLPLPYDLN